MQFLVHGVDGPAFDVGPDDRHEAHQAYMDGWLPRMIARGPTLSPDGEHTGSVHVLDLDDLNAARRFAAEEPYAAAGWYADVRVDPLLALVDGTMWDRPTPPRGTVSSFVRATWSAGAARPVDELTDLAPRVKGWLFAGLLLDPSGSARGFAGTVDASPADVTSTIEELLGAPVQTEVHRWQRGGRNQE